jgi:hypothetical protein
MAESTGVEPVRHSRAGYCLASRPIAALATFLGGRCRNRTHVPWFTEHLGFQDRCITTLPTVQIVSVVERDGVEPPMNLHTCGLQPRALPLSHRSVMERQYDRLREDRRAVFIVRQL